MGYFTSSYGSSPSGTYTPPTYGAASQSPAFSAPKPYDLSQFIQRPDLNAAYSAVSGQAANTGGGILQAVGTAPGYVYERPLAWLNTATNNGVPGQGLADQIVGQGTAIGNVLSGIGNVFGAISSFPARAQNAGVANMLQATYGLPDSAPLSAIPTTQGPVDFSHEANTSMDIARGALTSLPVLGQLIQALDAINGQQFKTAGDVRNYAYGLGWTPQDVQDLHNGVKGQWDFANKGLSTDPLANLVEQVAFDPTNVIFGAGLAGKLPTGLGFMEKWLAGANDARRAAGLSEVAPKAFDMWHAGRDLATDWHAVTYQGFAEQLGLMAGRATSLATQTYRRVALATTGAELGLTAADNLTGNNNPFLHPFADFARRASQDKPLSTNVVFSLVSALNFPLHDTVQTVRDRISAGRASVVGTDVVPEIVRTLAKEANPDVKTLPAAWKTLNELAPGGQTRVYQAIEWAMRSIAQDKIQRIGVDLVQPKSMAGLESEAMWAEQAIKIKVSNMIRKGEYSAPDILQRMKDFGTGERNFDEYGSGPRLQWNVAQYFKNFSEFADKSGTISQMANERMPITLKVMDALPLPKEHIQNLRAMVKSIGESNDGMVPKAQVRDIIDMTSQLVRDEPFKTKFAYWGGHSGPAMIPVKEIDALLAKAEKTGLPLADYQREAADWEARHQATMPGGRPQDPTTGRTTGTGLPVSDVRTIATSNLAARARNAGLRATELSDVQRLRSTPTVQAFEKSVAQALDRAGYAVDMVSQSVGFSAARHELAPKITVDMRPSPNILHDLNEVAVSLMEGGTKNKAHQADEVTQIVSARTAESVGLAPNAIESRWNIGNADPATANQLVQIVHDLGGMAEYDDTRGILFLWERGDQVASDIAEQVSQKVAALFPEDPATGRLSPEQDRVYFRKVINDRRASNAGLAGPGDANLTDLKRSIARGDNGVRAQRYYATDSYLATARQEAGLADTAGSRGLGRQRNATGQPAASGVASGELPQRVADSWANVEQAVTNGDNPIPHVDAFISELHNAVDPAVIPDALSNIREAVQARVGEGNPVPPRLDEALLRANEDLHANGGNMGQVIFDAHLDALGDTILPKLDPSLSDLTPEDKQSIAAYARKMWTEAPYHTLGLSPKREVQLRWNNDVGQILIDAPNKNRAWVNALMDHGPLSAITHFERQLFRPIRGDVRANDAKQALYDVLLQNGATVAEANGFYRALEGVRNLFELNHVKIFRSADALPRSVYEKLAAGKRATGQSGIWKFDVGATGFNGFSDEFLSRVGAGNVWKLVDAASSAWFRGLVDTAEKGGRSGSMARMLSNLYPVGMGLRHNVKIWYHVARFLTDPRWWAMNAAESEIILGTKYGVNVFGAGGHRPSGIADMFLNSKERKSGQAEAELALDATATGWYDTRRTIGQLAKVFDTEAPRSIQRFLDDLPRTDPIIKMMTDRFGTEKESWGQQLANDLESMDLRGAEKTVTAEAQRVLTEQDYVKLRDAGVIQAVWENMDKSWTDLKRTLHGNPDRALMERVLNSYWLFWPLSYQLKAGKWLYDTLTHQFAGKTTNFGGAWYLSQLQEKHQEQMANNPKYADMFNKHPETWFFASMFLPITPFDLSIGLSPFGKTVGGLSQAWAQPSYANDPFGFAARLATMGPVFTANMLSRIGQETFPQPKKPSTKKGVSNSGLTDYLR